jgi:hypothetical protein
VYAEALGHGADRVALDVAPRSPLLLPHVGHLPNTVPERRTSITSKIISEYSDVNSVGEWAA